MASDLDGLRASIESQVSTLWSSRTSIEFANRPFDAPASGGWLTVEIRWRDGESRCIGALGSGGMNLVGGTLELAISENDATGLGNVTRLAEYARAMVPSLGVSGVLFEAPSGPENVQLTGRLARAYVRTPFRFNEGI